MAKLSIDVEARLAKFQDGMDALSRDVTRQVRGIERAFGALGSAFGGVAAAVGAGAIGAAVKSVVGSMAALDDASIQTGISVKSLSSLLNTLAPTGVTLEQISDLAAKLSRAMSEAEQKTSRAAQTFAALGVATTDSSGNLRAIDDTLVDVARALNGLGNGTERAARAQELFGRTGAASLTILKDLAEFQREAASVTAEQATAAADLGDKLGRVAAQFRIIAQQVAGPVVTALLDIINRFNAAGDSAQNFYNRLRLALQPEREIRRLEADVQRLQANLEGLQSARVIPEFEADRVAEVAAVTERLARARRALADAAPVRALLETPRETPAAARPNAPSPRADDPARSARREQISDGARLLQNLQDRVVSTLQLTQVQRLQSDIARGRIRFDSEAQRVAALAAADQIDSIKRIAEASDQESAAAIRRIAVYEETEQAQGALAEAADRSARAQVESFLDLTDSTREYERQLQRVADLLRDGLLTPEQAERISQAMTERLLGAFSGIEDGARDAKRAADDIGFGFASAFEDAVVEGRQLREVLSGLAKDVARVFLRQTITAPLARFVSGGVEGLFSGVAGSVAGAAATATAGVATKAVPMAAPSLSFDLRNSALTKDFVQGVVAQAVTASRADRYDLQFRGVG